MKAVLSIRAVPGAGRDVCAGLMDDGLTWKIRLAAPAVDGKANAALVAFLAKRLGVSRGAVTIVSGGASRSKRVAIEGVSAEDAAGRMCSDD